MKKIRLIILSIVVLTAAQELGAQHYIGVRGGYGGGYGRFYPVSSGERRNQKMTFGLWSGGVAWKYYSPEKYLGGVGAEIEFLQRGFEYHLENNDSDSTYRRTVNSINIPLIWQPHFNIAGNKARIFLNAGINISYNINSQQYLMLKGEGVIFTKPYEMQLTRDNPFGFGLQGGLGFNLIFGKIEFLAEARYYFSFGDILRNRSKYYGYIDPDRGVRVYSPIRSPIDNFNVSVGLFYRIGDKPHEPPPGPKAIARSQQRMAEKEVKQAEKEMKQAEKAATRLEKEARQHEKEEKKDGKHETTESSEADTEGYQRDIQQGDERPGKGGDGNGDSRADES